MTLTDASPAQTTAAPDHRGTDHRGPAEPGTREPARRARRPHAGSQPARRALHRRRPAPGRARRALVAAVGLRRHRRRGARGGRLRHRRHRAGLGDGAARRRRAGPRLPQRLPAPRRPPGHRGPGLGGQHRVRLPPLDLQHRRTPRARPAARARDRPGLPVAALGPRPRDRGPAVLLPGRRAARRRGGGRGGARAVLRTPRPGPRQGGRADRPGRGRQLEAHHGEQPGVLPLRRPPGPAAHLLPDLGARGPPGPGPVARLARAVPARRCRARPALRGAGHALPDDQRPGGPTARLPGRAQPDGRGR